MKTYTATASSQVGASERTVRRDVARGNNVADLAAVIGTSLDNGAAHP